MSVDLDELLAEAKANARYYTRRWRKWDNSEDLHSMDTWQTVVAWLETWKTKKK